MPPKIFSVPIEGPSWPIIERSLHAHAQGSSAFWIVTANPEILLAAKEDAVYADAIRQADIRTVDGMGLWLALRAKGVSTTRLTGGALAEHLLEWAQSRQVKVGLIGGKTKEINAAALEHLRERYPDLRIVGEQGGTITHEGVMDEQGEEACVRLTLEEPEVLFVAFGHPRQERWLARHLHDFPTVRVAVGIGGVIDIWAKSLKPPPVYLKKLGLEWTWRLLQEPKRLPRILRAVIVFPCLVIWERIQSFFSSKKAS